MQGTMKINDDITVGPQPSEQQISELSQEGFKTVLNFRTEGEEDQPLSPQQEREKVQESGMEYANFPVSMDSMSTELVDQFRQRLSQFPTPVFAHCKSGKRAGALVMMKMAVEQGMSGQETLDKAEQMGFQCDQEQLRQFVKQYVDRHRHAS